MFIISWCGSCKEYIIAHATVMCWRVFLSNKVSSQLSHSDTTFSALLTHCMLVTWVQHGDIVYWEHACVCVSQHKYRSLSSFLLRTFVYSLSIKNGKPMPFQPFMFAILFCVLNSCAQTRTLGHFAQYPKSWLTDYHFVTGVALFFTGMAVNIHSDYILRNLRKPGETGYKIPKGEFDMFVHISFCYVCASIQAVEST